MGRPPLGKRAMSGAQRQARYMANLLGLKLPSKSKPAISDPERAARIARIRARIARIKAELKRQDKSWSE